MFQTYVRYVCMSFAGEIMKVRIKVKIKKAAVRKVYKVVGASVGSILQDVARSHAHRPAHEVEVELKRRMTAAGVKGGDYKDAALAISEGRPARIRLL